MDCVNKVMIVSSCALGTHLLVRSGLLGHKKLYTSKTSTDISEVDSYKINNQGLRLSYYEAFYKYSTNAVYYGFSWFPIKVIDNVNVNL
jgi:hypothetical protein